MPVYEYLCEDCVGVFELLRPVREASTDQPCPVCDADSRRLMPTEFAAYVLREGLPRRIPDQGKYWAATGVVDKLDDGSGSADGPGSMSPRPTTTADDDQEDARQRAMSQERQDAMESGRAPVIDSRLVEASNTYRKQKVNTLRRKKLLKTAANRDVTPRTRSGEHKETGAPTKKRAAKQ